MRDAPALFPSAPASVLAIDVGGTDVKAAVVDPEGRLGDVLRMRTPNGIPALIDRIAELVELARRAGSAPDVVGLVVPGVVEDGVAVYSENLGWSDVPLRQLVADRLGLPVAFGQDVRAAVAAELQLGRAASFRDPIAVIIGTGLSGAIVRDGRMLGGSALVGEFGHAPTTFSDEPCACGRFGCLEAVASAAAIERRYRARGGADVSGAAGVLLRGQAGDPLAAEVWDDAVNALAFSVAHLVAALAPDGVVIGGGLSRAGEALLAPLRERLARHLSFHRVPDLVAARWGGDAGVIGAALGARQLWDERELAGGGASS